MTRLVVVSALNCVVAAALYLNVVRSRRSAWWLGAFLVFGFPAPGLLCVRRRQETLSRNAHERGGCE